MNTGERPAAQPAGLCDGWRDDLRYGLLGLPLAFVALPLYVHLPHVYASRYGMSLATLGLVLLLARLFDAVTDPWLGRLGDRLYARSPRRVLMAGALSALVLVLGMAMLFFPPWARPDDPAALLAVLMLTCLAFSLLAIGHQSWGARLGGDEVQRTRIVAWREGAGLVGVVLASVLPATLVLFFIRDRLNAPTLEPLFLATYFVAAAASMPLWTRCVARWGLAHCWLAGMLLSVAVFAWAARLGSGDVVGFWWVCTLSGLALGTDLALPGALLAGLIAARGDRGQREGAYFGWWNLAGKLNLALAAGLALPLLQLLGYQPGNASPQGLHALTLAYAVLPCALKLLAALGLYFYGVRRTLVSSSTSSIAEAP